MSRKIFILLSLLAAFLTIIGCVVVQPDAAPGASPPETQANPTQPPPQPSPTPLPPTEPPPPPTETPAPYVPRPAGQIQLLRPGEALLITQIQMLDPSSGWALGSGQSDLNDHILFTRDGGASWADRTPPEPLQPGNSERKVAFAAFRGQRAWVIYQYMSYPPDVTPAVWRTSDSGLTWTSSAPLNLEGIAEVFAPDAPVFADDRHGWLMTHVGGGMNHDYVILFATSDSGDTWQRIADPFMGNFPQSCSKTGLAFAGADQGVLTGDCQGLIPGNIFAYQSANAGLSWSELSLPMPADAPDLLDNLDTMCGTYAPSFTSAQEGSLLVNCNIYNPDLARSYFYTTRDGGQSWSAARLPLAAPALQVLDASTAWIAGAKIFRTTNGGQSWSEMSAVSWRGQVNFIDAQNGWAAAKAGVAFLLLQTADGGATWNQLNPLVVP